MDKRTATEVMMEEFDKKRNTEVIGTLVEMKEMLKKLCVLIDILTMPMITMEEAPHEQSKIQDSKSPSE